MKTGKSLQELAVELERRKNEARDFIAPVGKLRMVADSDTDATGEINEPALAGLNGGTMGIANLGHSQIQSWTKIPKVYYDRLRQEEPELLAKNVNTWFERQPETRRMVRTLDGNVRAFLSNAYRPMDNFQLAEAVLPILSDKGCEVQSSELTDTRMYIKATLPSMRREITKSSRVDDVVEAGIVISNSEVGHGSLRVEPFLLALVCINGMVASTAMRKYHVGRRADLEEEVYQLLSDKTRRLDDAALWSKVRDVVAGSFNEDIFNTLVDSAEAATEDKITAPLPQVVELTAETYRLPDKTQASILENLSRGGDFSKWGLVNAITASANTADLYEHATELERLGGKVLELKPSEWKVLAEAA